MIEKGLIPSVFVLAVDDLWKQFSEGGLFSGKIYRMMIPIRRRTEIHRKGEALCLPENVVNSGERTGNMFFVKTENNPDQIVIHRAKGLKNKGSIYAEQKKALKNKVTEKDTLLQEGQRIFFSYK